MEVRSKFIIWSVVLISFAGMAVWITFHRAEERTVVERDSNEEVRQRIGFYSRNPIADEAGPTLERTNPERIEDIEDSDISEEHLLEKRSPETFSNMGREEQVDTDGVSTNIDEDLEEELLTEAEEYVISQIVSWLSEVDKLVLQLEEINQSIDATRTPEGNLSVDSLPFMDLKRDYEEEAENLITLLWDEEIRELVGDLPRKASRDLYELVNPPPPPGAMIIEVPASVREHPQKLEQFLRERLRMYSPKNSGSRVLRTKIQ